MMTTNRSLGFRLIVTFALLALSGCRGKQTPAATAPPADRGFPVVLKDAQGVVVRIERKPKRIVSLAPTVTEILFAIGDGDRVVAASDPADYPLKAAKLPRVGGWFTPSAEKTLGAEPDLVIGSRGNPPDLLASLRKTRCAVFTIDPATLSDILAAIKTIGTITGAEQGASKVIDHMEARLKAVAAKIGDVPRPKRPTAFIVIGMNPLWTAGSGTFQDDAIRAAGARNIAADKKGFTPFSAELLMAADPNFLLLSTMEGNPDQMRRDVLADPVMKRLSAARRNHLIILEANHIMRPGPRIVDAVEAMARALYPARFPSESKSNSSATSAR
jgi:iron complex transport system substrate-binding protein